MFDIVKTPEGYEWTCFQSAYGAAGGVAPTLDEAKVRLAIAEADIMERPFPPSVVKAMLADPSQFAGDFPTPEGVE